MLVGYARISTGEQTLDLQQDALTAAGCERVFTDVISGAKDERPGLTSALSHLRPAMCSSSGGLDRLGRTLTSLIDLLNQLAQREVEFKSLTEQIDTTPAGAS